jgi:hypothetical protein
VKLSTRRQGRSAHGPAALNRTGQVPALVSCPPCSLASMVFLMSLASTIAPQMVSFEGGK